MRLKTEPYFSDYIQRQLSEIRSLAPQLETVRTDHVPGRPSSKDPEVMIHPRQTAIIDAEHGRSFTLSLWRSRAQDQARKLGEFLKGDHEAVERIRECASLIAGCNPCGAWPIHPLESMPEAIVAQGSPPTGLSASSRDYLMEGLEDLREILPTTNEIRIRYVVTHTPNHVQRFRPFYTFIGKGKELAAIEAAMLVTITRHELGSPKTVDYYELNEARLELMCQQLSMERDNALVLSHVLPLFGPSYQATTLKLR